MYIVTKRCGEKFAVLYSPQHHDLIIKHKWHISKHGYVCTVDKISKKTIFMHRLILGLNYGDKRMCDHINGNRLDNRIENLRTCTAKENCRNKRIQKNKISIYKGVKKVKNGKFCAVIFADYKYYHIGTFLTEKEAALAYDEAAKRLHGEFARTNF